MMTTPWRATRALVAMAGVLAASAAGAAPSQAVQTYERERAECLRGSSNQDRATCLREASAALREARAGRLSTGDLAANRTQRCNALPAPDRNECLARMSEAGSASGTARDGGIIRELTSPAGTK
ncbi:hypothetical protein [Ramlibacter sp.]|uniref:hypothetical protein n=1 Tax=Ramlibacter sp. TaxID=1917967 RepID=UPI003D0D3FB3